MSAARRWLGRIRRHQNVTVALTVAVVCVVMAAATGFWLIFRLAYVILIALPLIYLWTRSMANGLDVQVMRRTHRVTQGRPLEGRVIVRSRSRLPKVWLEVEDPSDLPGHLTRRVITLGPRGADAWSYETIARRRGLYGLGPVTVTAADPFGFFRVTRTFGHREQVLVYPNAPELPNFHIPPANLPGDGRFRRRTHNVTPNVAGLRAYAPGDSYNRIHWPATARTGDLMVKLFELDPASDVWIVLDLEQPVHVGEGDSGTEEATVMIAASIARYFITANRSVGMIEFGETLRVDNPDRGSNHYTRLLESLALARAVGDVDLATLLLEESQHFGRHTTVVAITPSVNEAWTMALVSLAARGVKVAAVLLEAETFGAPTSSLEVYGTLAAGGVFAYTVKRTDDLVRVLGAGGEAGASQPGAVRA